MARLLLASALALCLTSSCVLFGEEDPSPVGDGTGESHMVVDFVSAVIRADGSVWTWGQNDFGPLGDGAFENRAESVQVRGLSDVVAISANYDCNLALLQDGSVWLWGLVDPDEKLGISTPVQIKGVSEAASICAYFNNLVQLENGTYYVFTSRDRGPQQVPFRSG